MIENTIPEQPKSIEQCNAISCSICRYNITRKMNKTNLIESCFYRLKLKLK